MKKNILVFLFFCFFPAIIFAKPNIQYEQGLGIMSIDDGEKSEFTYFVPISFLVYLIDNVEISQSLDLNFGLGLGVVGTGFCITSRFGFDYKIPTKNFDLVLGLDGDLGFAGLVHVTLFYQIKPSVKFQFTHWQFGADLFAQRMTNFVACKFWTFGLGFFIGYRF